MNTPAPFFSVIIPTYNRPGPLSACLEALACLDYPRDRFEVIVVDDGSEATPTVLVSSFRERLDVKLLTRPNGGPAAARNTGADRAKGPFLAFTDDDCRPAPDWLRALSGRLARVSECAVGGCTSNALPNNPYATASQLITDIVYAHYNAIPSQARFFASNNIAVPAACFQAIGRFDAVNFPFASEDRDFCDRWLHHGHSMFYEPQARVHHAHDLTFRCFLKQHFRYGCGAFRYHRARTRRGRGRFADTLAFYLDLPVLLRRQFRLVSRPWTVLFLLGLWQLVNTMGYLRGHLAGGRD